MVLKVHFMGIFKRFAAVSLLRVGLRRNEKPTRRCRCCMRTAEGIRKARRKWLERKPKASKIFTEPPETDPTKPTKLGFEGPGGGFAPASERLHTDCFPETV